jgi:hypothetical protein
MMTKLQPWDRQPDEPPKAWAAFARYRDLGTEKRSLRVVSEELGREAAHEEVPRNQQLALPPILKTVDLDKNPEGVYGQATNRLRKHAKGNVVAWSSRWNWVARVAAWDAHVDQHVKKRRLSEAVALTKRQQDYARSLGVIGSLVPATLLRKMNSPEGRAWLDGLPMDDLLGLSIELMGKMDRFQNAERVAYGVQVSPDEDAVGQFVWELKLKQPPAHAPEPSESADGSDNESDPYNVAPAWDPVG